MTRFFRTLRYTALVLAIFGLQLSAEDSKESVSFIHLSDLHFCNLEGYHPKIVERRSHYGSIAEPLTEFLKTMPKKLKADFIAVTGDLIDFHESSIPDGSLVGTQIEQFSELVKASSVPLYMTLGNHDITSYWQTESGYHNNQINAVKARATWTRNIDCFKNGTYYSHTVKAGETSYRLIFLDNGYYNTKTLKERTHNEDSNIIDETQLLWLEDQLNNLGDEIPIILMHIPLQNPEIGDLKPSRNTYPEDLDATAGRSYKLEETSEGPYNLLTVLKNCKTPPLILCGHRHSSTNSVLEIEGKDEPINQLMTGCFGRDTRNWRLIKLTSDKIIVSYVGSEEIQYTIPVKK